MNHLSDEHGQAQQPLFDNEPSRRPPGTQPPPALNLGAPGLETVEDTERIRGQRSRVSGLMADGRWRTLREIADACRCSEAGASARLRDLRKEEFGGATVDRRLRVRGVFEYQVEP